ncbi:MAG: Gfo/Idh/MocA family protein [Planctomycetota bacterium]|jgi:predicted dehydrogenase
MKEQKRNANQNHVRVSRRQFMSGAAAVAAFTIVPRHVLGGGQYTPPSDKLNIAGIGVGGKGAGDIGAVESENIVALCDVDDDRAGKTFEKYPSAKRYRDFRKMLEKEKNIDAVVVATPDHTHAVASMMAIKMGRHVYCEKPLTHSIYEARKLTKAAREAKVATQMGNQGHSSEGIRLICEWIWDGAIGPVREVHAWTDRPGGRWAQGVNRPQGTSPVPATLDWDLWLGPAPYRPYVEKAYCPFVWRGWWDFGTGALGDMACHIIDPVFWALKLGYPTSVRAVSTEVNSETAPLSSIVEYEFPERGDMPPVKLIWYDGGLMPTRPQELEKGRMMGSRNGGALFVGEKGKLMCGCYAKNPRLIPETAMQAYQRPPKTIERVEGHHKDWINACKGGKPASSNFDYAGPLTETVLLGNLAIRTGMRLDWDGPNMVCTNVPQANEYIHCQYRDGWTL